MKKRRFKEEEIVRILQEVERGSEPLAEQARKHGVSEQTIYRWRRKYGDLDVDETRKLRELEKENSRLKRMLADRDLEIDAMKDLLSKKW